jgi:hypothetical protein
LLNVSYLARQGRLGVAVETFVAESQNQQKELGDYSLLYSIYRSVFIK